MTSRIASNQLIAKNTLILYIRMLLVLGVSLYTSRVVFRTLGVEDFGAYDVVAGFVSLFSFLNVTLSASMQRFYNYEIGSKGHLGLSDVYSTGLYIHLALAVLAVILLETAGLWYVNHVLVVPPERLHSCNVLFQLAIFSLVVSIFQVPYSAAVMAYEKMNFYALVSILEVLVKLGAVVMLPFLPGDKLIVYGAIVSLISVMDLALYFFYSKKHFPELRFNGRFKKPVFASIFSFSMWNLFGTFAFMLKGQALNMVLNVFFGPVVNAARGIANQISGGVSGFSSNVAVAFRPQLVNRYAAGEHREAVRLMFTESRICFFLLSVLVVPVLVEMDYILKLWLGDTVPESTSLFALLMLLDLLICTLNTPCTQVAHAVGDIRKYQIVTSIINVLLVPAAYLLLRMGYPPASVFVATIVFSIINQTACVLIVNRMLGFGLLNYVRKVLLPCVLLLLVLPVLPVLLSRQLEVSFERFCMVTLLDLIIGLAAGYFIMLNASERLYLKSRLRTFFGEQDLGDDET